MQIILLTGIAGYHQTRHIETEGQTSESGGDKEILDFVIFTDNFA